SASDRPGDNSAELLFWESIKDSRNQAVFHAYLAQYPTGPFATLARLKLEELKPRQTANLQPPTVQVTETDARYVALKTANVRAGPSTTAAKQGKLTKDSGVTVTGEVAGGKWLRIERPNGGTGYVFATLLAPVESGELPAWRNVKDSQTASNVAAFLKAFPSGHFAARAKRLHAVLSSRTAALIPPKIEAPTVAKPAVGIYPGRKPAENFKDCEFCPEMVVIPPGSFRMGDFHGNGKDREKPIHEVHINYSFAVGKYEITRRQYAEFVRANDKSFTDGCDQHKDDKYETYLSRNWRDPGFNQTSSDPAVCISWVEAKQYVDWLNEVTPGRYRLLSEAEWEYVARADSRSVFSFGNDVADLCDHANSADKRLGVKWQNDECDDGYGWQTAPVGRYHANKFGLHDLYGNAVEWVEDCQHKNYQGAPTDGSAWISGGDCTIRMVRGGDAVGGTKSMRSAFRSWLAIEINQQFNGFRIAKTLTP
ncbi:MAG: SUMF1/EgtB/PvdO family nonheme iron enzyme, partial [Rhodospirillaceae bacterium]|nr:SUMF1/EgtB/PvdO family nonheme iron enzyme [Rhodospirillaceae bacterium]